MMCVRAYDHTTKTIEKICTKLLEQTLTLAQFLNVENKHNVKKSINNYHSREKKTN